MTTGRDHQVAAQVAAQSEYRGQSFLVERIATALSQVRAEALEEAADRSQERVGINPLWLRDDARKIRQGEL